MSASKVDILHINESKLDSTVRDDEVYIPGFEIVRKDRKVNGRNGGGVCTYVRFNLNCRIRNDFNDDHLLGIDPQVLHLIYLVNLRMLLLKLTQKIRNYIYSLISTAICCLKQLINSTCLINIFDIYGLSQLITEPTRVTPGLKKIN